MEKSINEKWIGSIVANNSEKLPNEIAKALAEQAKKNGSHDNISIVVVKLKALLKQDQRQMNECPYFIVCDGHGGGQPGPVRKTDTQKNGERWLPHD